MPKPVIITAHTICLTSDIDKDSLKDIDIDMVILEYIDIDIDLFENIVIVIDERIFQNIDINKMLKELGFGISNTPSPPSLLSFKMSTFCYSKYIYD